MEREGGSWRKERKWTQNNCEDKGRTHKEGNMETVTGDETRRERDQTQTRLGKDRGHGRLSQETQERDRAQKTDTNKLNSIKKLNSRLN